MKRVLSCGIILFGLSSAVQAMLPQECALKSEAITRNSHPETEPYGTDRLIRDIKKAYALANKKELIESLEKKGISRELLRKDPILSDTPRIQVKGVIKGNGGTVVLRVVSLINIYSQLGTFIAQVQMTTDLNLTPKKTTSENVSFQTVD